MSAASRAETAANDAVRATVLAKKAAQEAQRAAQLAEQLAPPDPHALIVAELASHEQTGLLNIGPKRNRWSELQAFDEQLVEAEQRREQLRHEIGELMTARNNEPARVATALDAWLMGGQKGARPTSQARRSTSRSQTWKPSTGRSASPTTGCSPSVPRTSRRAGSGCSPTCARRSKPPAASTQH